MNAETKPKFYKRQSFILLAGIMGGIALTILALILYSNPEYLTSLPFIRGAKNAITGDKEKTVTISDCSMNPPEIKLESADFKRDDLGNNSAKILFKNSDDKPHNIGVSGASGAISIQANGIQEFPVSAASEAGTMTITCDGKESLHISFVSDKEISNDNSTNYAAGEFNRLPNGIKDCANKILGSDRLPKLFNRSLVVAPEEQAKLSLCFYGTLSPEGKKCVADLAGGEQNLESFFKNMQNGDMLGSTANCMGIKQYSSLLSI